MRAHRLGPVPWWTDVCYLGFYGSRLVALLSSSSGRRSGSARPRWRPRRWRLLIAALALLWWWLVLRNVEGSQPTCSSLAGLSYPVLDLVLLCVVA